MKPFTLPTAPIGPAMLEPRVLAKSTPPTDATLAKLVAQFVTLGWWDQMSIVEREAFFQRGELLDSPFARETLLPIIKRSNLR